MKAVMISIQPEWCELMANGQKTIEVRKTRPKIDTPFKCYIYCTNNNGTLFMAYDGLHYAKDYVGRFDTACVNGKVIGEFVCDRIICSQAYFDERGKNHLTNVFEEDIKRTCLTEYDLWDYIAGKAVKANQMYDGYLWHISQLKIYDEPKEIGEFYSVAKSGSGCCVGCIYHEIPIEELLCRSCDGERNYLYRPPQSWQYVEEKEN